MDLITLADVRALLGHLPKATREKSTWQHVAAELDKAAAGADTAQVSIPLPGFASASDCGQDFRMWHAPALTASLIDAMPGADRATIVRR
jgi:hypothetical protein